MTAVVSPVAGARRAALLAVAAAFVGARVLIGVAWFVADRVGNLDGFSPVNRYFVWDGSFYRDIASAGYGAEEGLRFFPLYPVLGKVVGCLVGGPAVGLAVVANVAALVATWLLWELVRTHTGDPGLATRAAVVMTLFPAAAVMGLAYAEPLAIALGLGAALLVERRRFGWAIVALVAAGLTRPTSVLLSVPMLVLAVRDAPWRAFAASRVDGLRRCARWVAVMAAPPLGVTLYLGWLAVTDRAWRAPLEVQRSLRRGFAEPITRFLEMVIDVVTSQFRDVYNLAFAVVLIAAVVVAVRARYRIEWLAYTGVGLVTVLASNNVDSLGRYGFTLLPAWAVGFGVLAGRRSLYVAYVVLSSAAFVVVTTQWFRGAVIP